MRARLPAPMRAALAVLLALLAAPAEAQITVSAYTDRTTMGEAETLLYVIEATGDFERLEGVEAPPTRGLIALQTAPIQDWTTTRAGPQQRQRLRLQWQFEPVRTGTARLGAATVRIDGTAFTTDPIEVRVVPQGQRPSPPTAAPPPRGAPRPDDPAEEEAGDLFLRAEPREATAYAGQQVVVDYVLYFEAGVHPRNSRLARPWDAAGFWREDLELGPHTSAQSTTLGGRRLEAALLKRAALFPTRPGALEVSPLEVEVDVLRSGRRAGRFYNPFATRYERERVTAPPVRVEVRPLPPGAPPAFRGAVGRFEMEVRLEGGEVEVGEPVTVVASISGEGNLATLEAPELEAPDLFEAFPPRTEAEIERRAPRLSGEKRFTYTLVPRHGGAFALPPLAWAYFDPEAEAYRTLTSDSLFVRVLGPPAEAAPRAPGALRPLAEAVWVRARPSAPLWRRPWMWAGFGLPLAAFLALLGARRLRERRAGSPSLRRRRALRRAERALRRLPEAGPPPAFHAALEAALLGFLAEILGAAVRGLTREEIGALLAERGISEATRREALALLAASEQAQFAPHPPPPSPEAAARARRLLAALDEEMDGRGDVNT